MKQTSKMVMVAAALLAGFSGNAWANGTEMPPEPAPYTPPPAPMEAPAPAPAPVVKACDEGMYISGAAGIGFASLDSGQNIFNDDLDSGLVLNGALGYNFGSARLEAAVGYQSHDLSNYDEDVSLLTVMANAYYDFDAGSGVKPYVMAGAGIANADSSDDDSETVFAWQVGAGLGFEVAECTTLDLGYRYLKPNDFDNNVKFESHNVTLGLRYQF
ncbi:porin family protein [Chlorobaculum sp. 24CR]|uniref:outer membrane protein n=1 Tax=Chlorobaculum sp. 24CR TaxID=2508878 RepID=UPI00100BB60A|nr:outer membrane beta-barrel protein [Chlorobaculum sp. 24CR]RXK87707.1 porin family protein [Chlorobaculum sp. 24CR]